ncbi:hypothetical protein BkAM31D_24190 [Halalkalibacter krulwichiae]|uniref:Spore germination protein B3 n=1 Tax=Halalkalibacter krulwichiae TaxID=199441 RepID=A0A1X9MGZ3_9BACI|nr:hypothetical protein BkAM31D_24190 [Halalkalibacter krulwichiae]
MFASGCTTDMKEIQTLNYATAIGVDYKDGKYYIYTQLVGLASVAKTEGQSAPPQTFVSRAEGKTFIDAFFEVYQTGQERFIWAHITSIVLSEAVLEQGIENVFDGLTRYYEFRLTPWVFATKEPLDEVLTTLGFFDQSALETLLHNPQRIHKQSSIIRPIRLHQLARELFEPAQTTYLPYISIMEDKWQKNQESEPKLALEGAFFIEANSYNGAYTLEQLKGLRWLTPETKRASVLVPNEEDADFLAVIDRFGADISMTEGDTPTFSVVFNTEGLVSNQLDGLDQLKQMEEETSKSIQKEIEELFQLSIETKTDFFNFQHLLYREHPHKWKQFTKNDLLQEGKLENVTVNVKLRHTGAFKNKMVQVED